MRKLLSVALTLLTTAALSSSIPIKDNSDVALTLASNNYNRIVVQQDKIIEAVFPPGSMAIKRDEQDGSVYVMLASPTPFTLFLSTESGRHFSVTLNGEASLGKTIELVPQAQPFTKTAQPVGTTPFKRAANLAVPEAILAMLNHMEQQKPFADVRITRHVGKALRWSKGLTLLPKESWVSPLLKGEAIELYNGGKETLTLAEAWFAKAGTLAIKFSKPSIRPQERAMLYQVEEVSHG
ncbi:conjugative transfer protein TraK [Legionella beliardensis]|uniref:Conjugative transfer protein TraK n=1 Tax=Legionella beliardensis TaxID=91822 RepID=A0A378JPL0_9GAMM|nr:type-F conjugative transfer system secretin TraK [Legionella beliardensis]STX55695.1 conjugative transfer protein TraK [Legionella beliardensis]